MKREKKYNLYLFKKGDIELTVEKVWNAKAAVFNIAVTRQSYIQGFSIKLT